MILRQKATRACGVYLMGPEDLIILVVRRRSGALAQRYCGRLKAVVMDVGGVKEVGSGRS